MEEAMAKRVENKRNIMFASTCAQVTGFRETTRTPKWLSFLFGYYEMHYGNLWCV